MRIHQQAFATKSTLIRQAIANHKHWIEETLGIPLDEAVVITGLPNLSQVGAGKLLGMSNHRYTWSRETRRLWPLIAAAETPPNHTPMLSVPSEFKLALGFEGSSEDRVSGWSGLEWRECPLAIRLHILDCTIVLLNIAHCTDLTTSDETTSRLLIARRDATPKLVRLFDDLFKRDQTLYLHTIGGKSRRVARLPWEDIVIGDSVKTLLKEDLHSFWQREQWFRERKFPYRRGYLLHGPPGNGKTSAIRAMMTEHSLNAYTLRFFDPTVDDEALDALFEKAARHCPAIVLLEDIDRAFPKGESRCKISLQHLLNCLDGVATEEGIVIVATANEPANLDPAILRRPGRFYRLVPFLNPDAPLRLEYFRRMQSGLNDDQFQTAVDRSGGFSFALLREAYVIAGQLAFERGEGMIDEDLIKAIVMLKRGFSVSSHQSTYAGFGPKGG